MAELKKLVQRRGQLKGQLTRFETFLQNQQISRNELKIRLNKIENLPSEFERIQSEIDNLTIEDNEDDSNVNTELETEQFENHCFKLLSQAEDILQMLGAAVPQSNQFGHNNSMGSGTHSTVRLPTIELPQFSGSYDEWHQFYDTFSALIHSNAEITSIQKFYYLKSCLKGDAAQIVQSLEVSANNYSVSWQLLKDRYENKRLMVTSHIKQLYALEVVTKESHTLVRQLLDNFNKHFRALKALGQPVEHWDSLLVYMLSNKLDISTRKEWESSQSSQRQLPTLDSLLQFLKSRAEILESVSQARGEVIKPPQSSVLNNKYQKPTKTASFVASRVQTSCPLCNANHNIYRCTQFIQLQPQARLAEVKRLRLCINCFRDGHFVGDCRSSYCCKHCQKKHNTLLHLGSDTLQSASNTISNVAAINSRSSEVFLSTARVQVYDKFNKLHDCRVLLDNGSQSNYITERLCKRLMLPTKSTNMQVIGVGQNSTNVSSSVDITVYSNNNNHTMQVSCLVLPQITEKLPCTLVNISKFHIPNSIQLADNTFNKPADIDMLLGANWFYKLLCRGQINLGNQGPILQETKLGWVVSGEIEHSRTTLQTRAFCSTQSFNKINDNISKFWEIEEISVAKHYTSDELECENYFINNTVRSQSGHFIVRIPLKANIDLGDSRTAALRCFYNMEQKLVKNPSLQHQYSEFIREYIELGHMSKIENELENGNTYYLPHHPVIKESSETTKLRVVFDASCKTNLNKSLNEIQLVGPTIQNELLSIILRFRKYPIVITADVEKMYRQILIAEDQRDLQRIFWRDSSSEPLCVYRLNTVTYGTASAPFLAIRCLLQLANDNKSVYPEASKIIENDFYVDDMLTGGNTVEDVLKVFHEVSSILQQANFKLRKWSSNNNQVIKSIAAEEGERIIQVGKNNEIKTLGVSWNTEQDSLQYSVEVASNADTHTKRTILSAIAQIYDPLGLLGPIIIKAKIIMQQLWKEGLGWDDCVKGKIHTNWSSLMSELSVINALHIPRFILCKHANNIQFHGFCDASEAAYGACIYIRSQNSSGTVETHLICAKSRVAPLKSISLPKLELCGAVLLANLMIYVQEAMQIEIDSCTYWCDSTIVLHWLNASPQRWKTFVANRVSQVQSITSIGNWRHVGSADNPADLISRGVNPNQLSDLEIWWQGPAWLKDNQSKWPKSVHLQAKIDILPETRPLPTVGSVAITNVKFIQNFSCILRAKRIMAYILRFVYNTRHPLKLSGALTLSETTCSLQRIVKLAQHEVFHSEIKVLSKGKPVDKKSRLLKLAPFLDCNSMLRVGGRIQKSNNHFEKKHPLLLPAKHHLTKLILKYEHERLLHCGPQTLLASIRDNYWPISGRTLARQIVHSCITCFRAKPVFSQQQMGNLPTDRVTPNVPFLTTGVDFAGPFHLRNKRGRGSKIGKAYIALFVCFSTKAIHLELVGDLTGECFLAALRRFTSRRGRPNNIYSDNGSNFVRANRELTELDKFCKSEDLQSKIKFYSNDQGIQWHFIPPRAPHFGGIWEAGVKSMKTHLHRIYKDASLIYEDFITILHQIEAVLNSRPLSPLSSDPTDLNPLTPGHFLNGRPLTSLPDPNVSEIPDGRLSRYQRLQAMRQHFWKRWQTEYLTELQQRTKWNHQTDQVHTGALVILKEDNVPVMNWKLARIVEVHPGSDGLVRVVTVKDSNNVYKRPISRLAVLPIE